jgi:hypothetical protein
LGEWEVAMGALEGAEGWFGDDLFF